jgi:hypothetical protein
MEINALEVGSMWVQHIEINNILFCMHVVVIATLDQKTIMVI